MKLCNELSATDLGEGADGAVVAMAVARLQVQIRCGVLSRLASCFDCLHFGALGALGVEEALAHHFGAMGDHAAEVGVRGAQPSRRSGKLRCSQEVPGIIRRQGGTRMLR